MVISGKLTDVTITPRGFLLISGEPVSVSGICYGKPQLEAAGVANRRFAICHAFSEADVAALPAGLNFSDEIPADWRTPLIGE